MCGFNLIELLVVVAIISLIGAMALPSMMTTMNYRKVNAAMLSASGAIQSARYKSLSKGVPYEIQFNAAAGTYTVLACSNCAGTLYNPTGVFTYGADTTDPLTGVPIPFSSGTSGAVLSVSQNIYNIYFRPGGAVEWEGDGTLDCNVSDILNMKFTYNGFSKTMTVECYGNVTVPQ
jgi:prepilin-type N-terminal cleavage/methylation domain-containing protein